MKTLSLSEFKRFGFRQGLHMAESQGFEPQVHFCTQHFECCTFDHSDNSPGIKLFFADFGNWREKHARKIEIYKNSNLETLVNQGFHAEQTTNTEYGFECCTFDHSDNSPYSSVILAKEAEFVKSICLIFTLICLIFALMIFYGLFQSN